MLNKSNLITRRILNFPAVRPCESVSLCTLLTSLIELGHKICSFKLRTFFTNSKSSIVLIRLIETLVVFLEEISTVDDLMFLSLSELHFIFQKILFLLEDCSRDDARLWMLMKLEKVSTHFRVLTRSIAVALDVYPVVEVSEMHELVGFVKNQALKQKFEVEKDENMVLRKVFRILNQFEGGIAPESGDLKRVLEFLGIEGWVECNREIKFLENEIWIAGKRDLQFLSSLMAVLIYCRSTVCEHVEKSLKKSFLRNSGAERRIFMGLNPDDFRCPITLEIMVDPVTLSTGHTYERSSIQQWFDSGNHSCPKTGEKLICIDLAPNHALKNVIKQYCQENGVSFQETGLCNRESSVDPGSRVAEQSMKLLAAFLVCKLCNGTNEERFKSAQEIRVLTKTSIFNRSCLVEANAIPHLLNLLCSRNPVAQENAMAGLMNLSKYSKTKRIVFENNGLETIVQVLINGFRVEARQHAAGALFYLASVEEYRRTIGRIPGVFPALMALVSYGPDRAKKNALVAILGLLLYNENHWKVLSAGSVQLIIDLLKSSEREDLIIDSLAVLATLAENLDGAMSIVSAGAIPIILQVLCSIGSKSAKEYCVSMLLALCVNDRADVVPILVKSPSLMVALYGVLADGTSRSSKKASSLIRILHAFNEKGSSGLMMGSALHQEQFIHVW